MRSLVETIRKAAVAGRTEEDLKIVMEQQLRKYREVRNSEVVVAPSYEVRTGLAGRRDAVYGHSTLEYKRPGYLANESNTELAAQQLAEYLVAAAEETGNEEEALTRVAGACTDGQKIFFLRYWPKELIHARRVGVRPELTLFVTDKAPGGFQLLGPYPVNEASLEELFRYLRALKRRPLIAEALAETFGPGSVITKKVVEALYEALVTAESNRVNILYQQWTRVFGVIYGEKTAKAEQEVPELAERYGLPQDARLRPFLFAIHTYFALIMKLLTAETLALQEGSLASSVLADLPGLDGDSLLERLHRLEAGEDYTAYGIRNFLESDFFRSYLDAWNDSVRDALRGCTQEKLWF